MLRRQKDKKSVSQPLRSAKCLLRIDFHCNVFVVVQLSSELNPEDFIFYIPKMENVEKKQKRLLPKLVFCPRQAHFHTDHSALT